MHVNKGIAVSPGVAVYPAVVLDARQQSIPRRTVPTAKVPQQRERLAEALAQARADLDQLRDQTAASLGDELAKIFTFHRAMLDDPALVGQIERLIDEERVTAEYAVFASLRRLAQTFLHHDNTYFKERVSDIWDLERRILEVLIGQTQSELTRLSRPCVIVAHDLTPSQTAALDKKKIKAIATDAGGRTSHTAILAHALGIPAIVGLENITASVSTGDTVIVDGNRGLAVIDPDAAKLLEYRQEQRRLKAISKGLSELRDQPAVTKDGTEIELLANIEFATEVSEAIHNGARGVGLYRTEFLFLAADEEPSEQQQYEAYADAIRKLDGLPMTIRTLDLGADKVTRQMEDAVEHTERNPFLGCRSIRLCLQNLPLFRTQLRAILRASVLGPVQIMFPLVSNIMELRQARMIFADVREDLADEGIEFAEDVPLGMMIEVPSAALQARTFTREADFFSIGTNDLIQYTVAVDRSNERIANLYSAGHPAVIMLIKEVLRVAGRAKMPVSLCGEMAGEPEFVMLLLGMGLRKLSMTPPAIPEIKRIIREVSIDQCQRVARKVNSFDSDREVINYLRDEVSKIMPGEFDGRSVEY